MFGLKHRQLVGDGKVHCPVRHEDVDLERCLACPSLRSVDTKPGSRAISEINCVSERFLDDLLNMPPR